MSRCRPCPRRRPVDRKRRPADRGLLIARIGYWLPVLSDTELEAVAWVAEQLGEAAERLQRAQKARERRDRS